MSQTFIDQETGRPYAVDPVTGTTYWLDEIPGGPTATQKPAPAPHDAPAFPPAQPPHHSGSGHHAATSFPEQPGVPHAQISHAIPGYATSGYAPIPNAAPAQEPSPSKWLLVGAAGIAVVMFIIGFTSGRLTGGSDDTGGNSTASSPGAINDKSELKESALDVNKVVTTDKMKFEIKKMTTGVAALKFGAADGEPAGQFVLVEITVTNGDSRDRFADPDRQSIITNSDKRFEGGLTDFESLNGRFKSLIPKGSSRTLKYAFDIPLNAKPVKLSLDGGSLSTDEDLIVDLPTS